MPFLTPGLPFPWGEVIADMLAASDPASAVAMHWPTDLGARVHVLAAGKASLGMAVAGVERLAGRCAGGLAMVVPELAAGAEAGRLVRAGVEVIAADHPRASERNVAAARRVAEFVERLEPTDSLLVLLSGGASAHLTLPAPGLDLEVVAGVSAALMRAGAAIGELNAVRKHLEQLKGGRLAQRCRAGRIVALVLSDVIGDALDAIGSGPFAPDPTTFADALDVLGRWGVEGAAPRAGEFLRRGRGGELAETPKPGEVCFTRVAHRVIARNDTALDASVRTLEAQGIGVESIRRGAAGEAAGLAAELVAQAQGGPAGSARPRAWILGGEPTVRVGRGTGTGGPAQELALAGARLISGADRTELLAFSTDGRDGPTDAAGALLRGETWGAIARTGLDPAGLLGNHDSHAALDRVGALIRTGPTGTNVNHVAVLLEY